MTLSTHEVHRERHWTCARRMSERRHELGLTQCEIVERLTALGIAGSNRTLSAMEHGQGVDVGRLPEIAAALECTVTYLLGLTIDPGRWAPDDVAVPVAVVASYPSGSSYAAGPGWILGPDIPERATDRHDA